MLTKMKYSELKHGTRQLTGFDLSKRVFHKLLHEFNNYEMPIGQRIKIININDFVTFVINKCIKQN